MILTFSTGKIRLTKVIYNLQNTDHQYSLYPRNTNRYLEIIKEKNPDYILGMGNYSGRDKDKIRIETICTNKYRNGYSEGDEELKLDIPYFLTEDANFKLAYAAGRSYCNLAAYRITKFIQENNLKTKFTFLHVPKNWKLNKVESVINKKIQSYIERY